MSRHADSTAFAEVCELIGPEAATALQRILAGRRIYVPRSLGADHPLAVAIGLDLAQRVVERCAGDSLDIPLSLPQRSRIVALKAAGRTVNQIISELRVSRRSVFYALAQKPAAKDPDQLEFF